MNSEKKYQKIQRFFTTHIQKGAYPVGSYLPSEHEICERFDTTRTTVRKALDELLKNGFIEKEHGRGSKVVERRKSLGLLTVKGFSEALDHNKKTVILQEPTSQPWDERIPFRLTEKEKKANAIYFQRLRFVNGVPIMLEHNWYSELQLQPLKASEFIDGSFFKTLSQHLLIEVKGSEHELRAEGADAEVAKFLEIDGGAPVLHISIRFTTSKPGFYLYSEVYCNTAHYPVSNRYFL